MHHQESYQSPELHTAHLILRPVQLSDAADMFIQRTDPVVNRYVPIKPPAEISEVTALITKIIIDTAARKSDFWIITNKDGKYMGIVCLWNYNWEANTAELGFVLLQHAWNKGYATEAVGEALAFAKKTLPFTRIEGWTHQQNFGAQKVMQKNNMQRDLPAEAEIDPNSDGAEMQIWVLQKR
jgi:ribosomal-protein-alanine N-acetyltransferase